MRFIDLIVLSCSPSLTFSEIVSGTLCNIVHICLYNHIQYVLLWQKEMILHKFEFNLGLYR